MHSRIYRVGEFNMLPEYSRQLRELSWQPNLDKNMAKLHKLSCPDCIVRPRNVVNGS